MTGHLDLVCAADAAGRTFISRQSFCAPMHLSKPHLDSGLLVVNVVNPTAGLFAGDRVECRVQVEAGARVLLTAPSASRAHRSGSGTAELAQEFSVAAGGWLDSWPELFIPQGGARYRQMTTARVEEGGELLLTEMVAPGRTAFGEVFAFAELDWQTELFLGDQMIARERYALDPANPTMLALRARFPTPYYASCLVVSPRLTSSQACWQRIHDLHSAEAWVGCSALSRGGWAIRVLAGGSVVLRKIMTIIRRELYAARGEPIPALRRN